MRVLVVEDDPNKLKQLRRMLNEEFPAWSIMEARSFQSGLKEVILNRPDIVLLDMTLPTHNVVGKETGGFERRYAGEEILRRVQRARAMVLAIVVTQFERFGEGKDLVTLEELNERLERRFPESYRGSVFYQAANTEWRSGLKELLSNAAEEKRQEKSAYEGSDYR